MFSLGMFWSVFGVLLVVIDYAVKLCHILPIQMKKK